MKYDYIAIGNRIRQERKDNHWSQDDLIEKLSSYGFHIGRNKLSEIEQGKTKHYDSDFLYLLCDIFNCELGYILCEDGYENKTRKDTDIVKEIGLSRQAIKILHILKDDIDYTDTISRIIENEHSLSLLNDIINYIFCDTEEEFQSLKTGAWNKIPSIDISRNAILAKTFVILNEIKEEMVIATGQPYQPYPFHIQKQLKENDIVQKP